MRSDRGGRGDFDRTPESVPTGDETDMLTVVETAKELGVSRATLYAFMDRGIIFPIPYNPHMARPRRHLFTRSEVDRVKRAEKELQRARNRGDR